MISVIQIRSTCTPFVLNRYTVCIPSQAIWVEFSSIDTASVLIAVIHRYTVCTPSIYTRGLLTLGDSQGNSIADIQPNSSGHFLLTNIDLVAYQSPKG